MYGVAYWLMFLFEDSLRIKLFSPGYKLPEIFYHLKMFTDMNFEETPAMQKCRKCEAEQ